MMIEVGIDNKLWWSKQDQILRYVEQLLEKREEDLSNEKPSSKKSLKVPYTFDEPILLTIITVDKEKMKVRFGMFLCTRKKAHTDYRLRCTERRPDVYEQCPIVKKGYEQILLIKDKPGSSQHAFGEPMSPSKIKEDKNNGKMPDLEWLWEFNGQIKVIATPYHEGIHYATNPKQLIPIVEYLHEMHKSGYVHGDIRAYNMVLNYEDQENPKGWLIDFDFGGHFAKESPKYPTGYAHSLDDGFRIGKEGKPITFAQDWYALGQIIFDKCYKLSHINIRSVEADVMYTLSESPQKFSELYDEFKSVLSYAKDTSEDLTEKVNAMNAAAASKLCDYLNHASAALLNHGYAFNLDGRFSQSLVDCNLKPEEQNIINDVTDVTNSTVLEENVCGPRKDSKIATGSPKKDAKP